MSPLNIRATVRPRTWLISKMSCFILSAFWFLGLYIPQLCKAHGAHMSFVGEGAHLLSTPPQVSGSWFPKWWVFSASSRSIKKLETVCHLTHWEMISVNTFGSCLFHLFCLHMCTSLHRSPWYSKRWSCFYHLLCLKHSSFVILHELFNGCTVFHCRPLS